MIIKAICNPVFSLLIMLCNNISISIDTPNWITSTLSLISKALIFFPADVWSVVIGNVLFWTSLHFVWAIIEWVYKKIPGVN